MPPARTLARSPQIRGVVLRAYEVATIADVDFYLRGLKSWLIRSIEERPAETLEHIRRYNADLDLMLDARLTFMGIGS
jgi:hypothetical protein